MDKFGQIYEQFRVHANDLADKIADLIHEGNVRRIIIKDTSGHTFMEIPLTVATVGVVLAPLLAAVGAIAALVSHFEVVVERTGPPSSGPSAGGGTAAGATAGRGFGGGKSGAATDASVGATENKMDMKDTVAQHSDNRGTKLEDLGGTGEHDSQGG